MEAVPDENASGPRALIGRLEDKPRTPADSGTDESDGFLIGCCLRKYAYKLCIE